MAEQIVNILADDITYDPDPPIIKHGDTVRFVMDGREDAVFVDFTEGTPFAQSTFGLNGSELTMSAKSETVVSNVIARTYPFFVIPDERERGVPEPPGTLSGDLEVVTDPPHDDDNK
jgi:hypothetical protein